MINHRPGTPRDAQTGMGGGIREGCLGSASQEPGAAASQAPPAHLRPAGEMPPSLWGRQDLVPNRTFRSNTSFGELLHLVRHPRLTITGTVMPLTSPGERCRRRQWRHQELGMRMLRDTSTGALWNEQQLPLSFY